MKKMMLALAVLSANYCFGQITIERTTSGVQQLGFFVSDVNGEKLAESDTGSYTMRLLNTDYSLWKTVHIPSYSGYKLSYLTEISDHLFNSDDNVEFVAHYTNTSTYKPKIVICGESGEILSLPSSDYISSYVYKFGGKYKLQCTSTSGITTYSLPGTLPCLLCGTIKAGISTVSTDDNNPALMPNPASDRVNITYDIPTDGILTIYNSVGQIVRTTSLSRMDKVVTVATGDLQAGVYHYTINSNGTQRTSSFVKQ